MSIVFVSGTSNEPMVSSREVAAKFMKEHREVLRGAREIMSSIDAEFSRCNFAQRDYVDSRGKSQPEILMSKNGFAILAMGFTGAEALTWKIRFIDAFDQMLKEVLELKEKLAAADETILRLQLEERDAELARKEKVIQRLQKKKAPKRWLVPDSSQPHFDGFEPPLVSKPETEMSPEETKVAKREHVIKTMNGLVKKHILEVTAQEKADIICAFVRGFVE